jgi:short-subunit dehydrogenase
MSICCVYSYNVQVDYVRADLSKKTDIESLWSEVTRLYPDGIDILVNNAGNAKLYSLSNK